MKRAYGADIGAVSATHAIERVDLHLILLIGCFWLRIDSAEVCRSFRLFLRVQQERAYGGMRADHGTLVALYTLISQPLGNVHGYPAFFKSRCA